MNHRVVKKAIWLGLALAVLCGAGVGCSSQSDPLSPAATETSTPPWAHDLSPESGSKSSGLLGGLARTLTRLVSIVEFVLPTESAVLESGRYLLSVPAGALDYPAEYRLEHAAGAVVQVDLFPHGAEFDNPVLLEIDLRGTSLAQYNDITLYWWDEVSGEWVDVGGAWDPASKTLSTELEHFSRYRPGRAGW